MDALSLNYWLSKFVMEVAKKSGERYPPKSVYGIICALKRYLEEKNGSEALNSLDAGDKRFVLLRRCLDAEMKIGVREGLHIKCCCIVIVSNDFSGKNAVFRIIIKTD
ncbi:uncharacterized protein LOC144648189 [Oculina patagonica]